THIVLLNHGAGSMGDDPVGTLRAHFARHGVKAEVRLLPEGTDVAKAAEDARAESPQVIVAGGGDGTINAVAGALVDTDVVLGVLPLGTLNHFAKDMGIPLDLEQAVEVACGGRVTRVDVARVNGRLFVNNSSLGLYPQVVRAREAITQRLGHAKWPAFLWAAVGALRRYPFMQVQLTTDARTRSYRTPLVFIGNNSYILDGLELGERACLTAGHLSVHVVKRSDRLGLLVLAARALVGRLRQGHDFETFCATEVRIAARRTSLMVATDGEVNRLDTPLAYVIEPRALAVLVPSQVSAQRR
ncbi:MAG: diacylglycerol kinase family protein, partial [Casimicrobiaceae bacterium]